MVLLGDDARLLTRLAVRTGLVVDVVVLQRIGQTKRVV